MNWYAESIVGTTPYTRRKALAKLPAEIVAILQEKGLTNAGSGAEEQTGENARLPEELMNMVRGYVDADLQALPMGFDEAREHRAKLMQERGAFHHVAEKGWRQHSYNFCEH